MIVRLLAAVEGGAMWIVGFAVTLSILMLAAVVVERLGLAWHEAQRRRAERRYRRAADLAMEGDAAGLRELASLPWRHRVAVARLIGMSPRIQSVRFSPDGTKLAVTGGRPAQMGEVQIWDVAERKLLVSVPVTNDTVFGASWSPDGKRVAFGGTDKSLRAINAETGEQVLYQTAHDDWVLGTTFSTDSLRFTFTGAPTTVDQTVNVGWTFHP